MNMLFRIGPLVCILVGLVLLLSIFSLDGDMRYRQEQAEKAWNQQNSCEMRHHSYWDTRRRNQLAKEHYENFGKWQRYRFVKIGVLVGGPLLILLGVAFYWFRWRIGLRRRREEDLPILEPIAIVQDTGEANPGG